ncbi:camk camk1 camk1-cmk kinase [Apiospora arundinis]|uniref:Camk camk1 camk1-cmk kinase n=1 Tax=Apiospora arundinis TaxID=335852 RepID=A0ABR2JIL4_9PEZI
MDKTVYGSGGTEQAVDKDVACDEDGNTPRYLQESGTSSEEDGDSGDDYDEEAIYDTTIACLCLFSNISRNMDSSDKSPQPGQPEQSSREQSSNVDESVMDLSRSFDIWIDYTGALASDESRALDARLQGFKDIKNMILNLLEMLSDNLQHLNNPPKQGADSDEGGDLRQEAINSSRFAVEELHFMANVIRKSSVRNQIYNLSSDFGKDNDHYFENYVFLLVKHTFPHARISLCKQLSTSIAVRRKRLDHKIRHGQKLKTRRIPPSQVRSDQTRAHISQPVTSRLQLPPNPYPKPLHVPEKGNRVVPSSSIGTRSHLNVEMARRGLKARPSFSTISTGSSVRLSTRSYPPKPTFPVGATDCACPYCSQPLSVPKLIHNPSYWNSHLDADIEPYTCLSEQCTSPLLFFVGMDDWIKHMTSMHSEQWASKIHMSTWYCDTGHESMQFNDLESFKKHMVEPDAHPERSIPSASQLDSLCRTRQRVLVRDDAYACPLCDCVPDSLKPVVPTGNSRDLLHQLHRHIASHIKDLAPLSIPTQALPDTTESLSDKSADEEKRRQLRSMSDEEASYPSGYDEGIREVSLSEEENPEERPLLDVEETCETHWRDIDVDSKWHTGGPLLHVHHTIPPDPGSDTILQHFIQAQGYDGGDVDMLYGQTSPVPMTMAGNEDPLTTPNIDSIRPGHYKINHVLCAPCSSISLQLEARGRHRIPIPPLTSTCPMCKMFDWLQGTLQGPPTEPPRQSCEFIVNNLIDSNSIFGVWRELEYDIDNRDLDIGEVSNAGFSPSVTGEQTRGISTGQERFCIITRPSLNEPQAPDSSHSHLIIEPKIRYDAARSLIAECMDKHEKQCGAPAKHIAVPLQSFRLIHCDSRSVRFAEEGCCYVALSYIVGNHPHHRSAAFGNPPKYPPTIEDAIQVTIGLGFAYLWVDQYCIDFANPKDKKTQFRQIGQIYQKAALTIVASAGKGLDYGLPGVSRARTGLPDPIVRPSYTIRPLPNYPHAHIRNSEWATWGWTYQEAFLSRRCLFFTDSQMYYECQGMNRNEISLGRFSNFNYRSSLFPKSDLTTYDLLDCITDYSARTFTVVSDRLVAFLGVLDTFLTAVPDPIYHLWGVPFKVNHEEQQYRLYLGSWSVEPSDRIYGFPSWSWLGWTGQASLKARIVADTLDYSAIISVKVEEAGHMVELQPSLLKRYYPHHPESIPENAPAALQLESLAFPIYAVKHVRTNPGCTLIEIRQTRRMVDQYSNVDASALSEKFPKANWICWQDVGGRWVYAEYEPIDRSFIAGLHENEKTELLSVALVRYSEKWEDDWSSSDDTKEQVPDETGYFAVLHDVEGGYETVGYLSLRGWKRLYIEVGEDASLQDELRIHCWPKMTQQVVRWL